MGNNLSLNQARAITTASFVVNFATQVYGMVTKPDMKQVADAVRPLLATSFVSYSHSTDRSGRSAESLLLLAQPLLHRRSFLPSIARPGLLAEGSLQDAAAERK